MVHEEEEAAAKAKRNSSSSKGEETNGMSNVSVCQKNLLYCSLYDSCFEFF